jgi:hypothetical protein
VSIKNRCLLGMSMTKRRPVAVVQKCAAGDVCCASFPAGCTCRAENNFAPISEVPVTPAGGCYSVMPGRR